MISFTCFKGLPLEYESFLKEKYNSYITTCRYVEVYYPTYDINYMLVYENENLIELLLYGNKGDTTRCFNALVELDQNIIKEFVKKIFETYLPIKKVHIDASYKNYDLKKTILSFKSNDNILQLPTTMEEYYNRLSSGTRKKIKSQKARLLKDFNDVKFITKFGAEIDEKLIDRIMQLNFNKMKYSGAFHRNNITNAVSTNNLFKYTHHYGCVAYIEINGEIIAGNISTIINRSLFGHVTAFNPNYNKYSVGEICLFYLIQTCIENGLPIFHFLWGQSDWKKKMQAEPNLLFSYLIYKSYSFDYLFINIKVMFSKLLIKVKQSKLSNPLKIAIKYSMNKDWNYILRFMTSNRIVKKKYSGM